MLYPVPAPAAVVAAERAILAAEGDSHVCGRYYRQGADYARRLEAERRVAVAERRAAFEARHPACAWCAMYHRDGEVFTEIGGAPVHADGCADMLARFLASADATLGAPASLMSYVLRAQQPAA